MTANRILSYVATCFFSVSIIFGCDKASQDDLTVLISPYQDLAMLVNIEQLGLEEKYGTEVDIKTIPWEETYTTILSSNSPADVAFASYADFLTKEKNLNKDSSDDLRFIFPAYIFRGGAFITFRDDISLLDKEDLKSPGEIKKFLGYRIGIPKDTLYQMLLFNLAIHAGVPVENVNFIDVGFDTGLLAAKSGDLDISAVGLTQLTEAEKDGGKTVLNMDTMGVADITGFIVRESVLREKREHIGNLIRMWFDCVDYVFSDLDKNSDVSLEYLAENAATQYTLESYKSALSQEYFPRSLKEIRVNILETDGKYSAERIHEIIYSFLKEQGRDVEDIEKPNFINIE